MADIRDLAGNPVDTEKLGADPKIAELLADLAAKNKRGRLKAIMVVFLTPEDWYGSTWAWGHAAGPEVGLLAIGALATLQDELHAKMRAMPEKEEPKDDGA